MHAFTYEWFCLIACRTFRTIPLVEVVDCMYMTGDPYRRFRCTHDTIVLFSAFDIFHSAQGSQGYQGRPSKQQLENTFGTSKDVEVVKALLERGKEQSGEGFHSGGVYSLNTTRGSAVVDSRGKGLSGI